MGIDAVLVIRVPETPTREQVLRWSWDVAASLGADWFFLDAKEGRSALMWKNDDEACYGPGLYVQTLARFYGEGYERGPLTWLCAVAEWAEQNIPGAQVEYGGDSDEVLQPFGSERRAELKAHMYGPHGHDYGKDRNGEPPYPTPGPCSLCKPEGPVFHRNGWGYRYCNVSCAGCGQSWSSHDDGATFVDSRERHNP